MDEGVKRDWWMRGKERLMDEGVKRDWWMRG